MQIPAEFSHRVLKTGLRGMGSFPKEFLKIIDIYPGVEVDVIYENLRPVVVLVFETQEDCLAFKLTHGDIL